jgi:hypothetical protein
LSDWDLEKEFLSLSFRQRRRIAEQYLFEIIDQSSAGTSNLNEASHLLRQGGRTTFNPLHPIQFNPSCRSDAECTRRQRALAG